MDYRPRIEHEIAELRVRRTWTGKLVMQLRRKCRKPILTPPPALETKWEEAGIGPWKDANGNDAAEIAEVAAALSSNA